MDRIDKDRWIKASFAVLAQSGIDGVRVEVLAKNLGVTKGGFYRRFRDRAALLEDMLNTWSQGRIEAIRQQANLDRDSAQDRLRALIQLYTERINTQAISIELAVRQWARSDEAAAAAVAIVDQARLKNLGQLYRAMGLSQQEAERKSFLFYSFLFGQSLLVLEHGPRKRSRLLSTTADDLIGVVSEASRRHS